eukprot:CAMPEP_0202417032 /NCGR_PEP_ID=MMETSP1128-20130828/41664_1 /ASSEMBLY_ACC=CAM_ASM_000463 /TAXON_ID=3047 /ORGANISM="Dunaliella tertiolecta, Strain CCMP1320" /LENGTH=413 /DNA_ID=CAMNT_0049024217 /DNA_START=87 /DNA_END=1325 /DNA_ORIENTATION=+
MSAESNASGYSDEVKVIAPQTLLISDFAGPEKKVGEVLPASYTIASPRPRTTVSPSQTSDFGLPPGGVDAATRKLQDELQALRAMKRARFAQANPAAPNGHAASNPSKRRSSISYYRPQISEVGTNGTEPLDRDVRTSPSPSPPFSASSSGMDASASAAPAARAGAGGDATGALQAHISSSEIEPCGGPALTPAPLTSQPLHHGESQRQSSQPQEATSSDPSPPAASAAGGGQDLSYEQWCMQSEQTLTRGEASGPPAAQAPMVGDERARLSLSHRTSSASAHELPELQVGDDSYGPDLTLRDAASVAPQALPQVSQIAPDYRASPNLPFPPPGTVQQHLSQGMGGQENAQNTSNSQELPLPQTQARSAHQATDGLAKRRLTKAVSAGRLGADGQKMAVRFVGASDDDETSSN